MSTNGTGRRDGAENLAASAVAVGQRLLGDGAVDEPRVPIIVPDCEGNGDARHPAGSVSGWRWLEAQLTSHAWAFQPGLSTVKPLSRLVIKKLDAS